MGQQFPCLCVTNGSKSHEVMGRVGNRKFTSKSSGMIALVGVITEYWGGKLIFILIFAGIRIQKLQAGQVKKGLSTISNLYPELKIVAVA